MTGQGSDTVTGGQSQDAPPPLTADQRAYVEELAAVMTASGMPRMASRVYAAILVHERGSMTSAEVAQTLQVSPAAVSTAVRWLTQVSMVTRRTVPGSRRESYRVDSDSLIRLITHDTNALTSWVTGFARGREVVAPDSAAARRLAELEEFFQFLIEEMDGVMERWEEHLAQSRPSRSARKR